MNVHSLGWRSDWVSEVNTSLRYFMVGYASLHTAYGPAVWATQFSQNSGGDTARWGVWNLITNRFYPSSGWMRAVSALCPY